MVKDASETISNAISNAKITTNGKEKDEEMEGKNPVVSLWMDPSRCLITPPALILATRRVRTPLRFSAGIKEVTLETTVTIMMKML